MKPVNPQVLHKLEEKAREIGGLIGKSLAEGMGKRYGFTLMLFSFDGAELTWISNANRDDMVELLKEFQAALQSGEADALSRPKGKG
jgi:hypothetical protein